MAFEALHDKLSTVFNDKSFTAVKTGLSGASVGLNLGAIFVVASAIAGATVAAPAVLVGAAVVGGVATAGQAYKNYKKKAAKAVKDTPALA